MPRLLLRVLLGLALLALIACVFSGLVAFSLGFGPDAPLPREAATVLLVWAGAGALGSGPGAWWLGQKLNHA
ncbi:hypothetical protein L1280_001027 [Deinococcus sp. HSC-46F16]|uniref:hypothetical protein n=1 Tax=Deinococcus sp. HSC-46F16 TaxID=2910968 RepID=UPI00209F50C1|nr:hypothetical protein [Deinococcus sp. HSC-46F16]MCP2013899.1 hypothetical protein [Deinococcus sp. HSC-46F16]